MASANRPIGFMSYVRFGDQHDGGRLTEFCKRLSGELQMQTGDEFPIFQDREAIGWGQSWKHRIDDSLDAATFLFPILTPGFFKSAACRNELQRFLERERKLGRNDLILPVYYVDCHVLNDPAQRQADDLAKIIVERQYADWRELRFEPFSSSQIGKAFARLATQAMEALGRGPVGDEIASSAKTPELTETDQSPAAVKLEEEQPERSRRPVGKAEPPIHIVDALHRGDFSTITDALHAAQPGDRILIRPGLYR